MTVIEQILDLARWAPSGDNAQPWRFEIVDETRLVVHGFDTREHCVYDFEGRASQIALGAMLETMRIAATGHGKRVHVVRRRDAPDAKPTFEITLVPDERCTPSELNVAITTRAVQRRPMRTTPLTEAQKTELAASVGPGFRIVWRESLVERMQLARLLFQSAKIRLTMPEAYAVHRDAIQYHARFSEDRIPDQAVGLNPFALTVMRWVMQSWGRVKFFNTFLAGTVLPRLELDLVPALACAGHFLLIAQKTPSQLDDYVDAGAAVQRLWLTATTLGLLIQPQMTPLIFSWYVRAGKRFSAIPALQYQAHTLNDRLNAHFGIGDMNGAVFFGRIGNGPAPLSRSLRLPLSKLVSNQFNYRDASLGAGPN